MLSFQEVKEGGMEEDLIKALETLYAEYIKKFEIENSKEPSVNEEKKEEVTDQRIVLKGANSNP